MNFSLSQITVISPQTGEHDPTFTPISWHDEGINFAPNSNNNSDLDRFLGAAGAYDILERAFQRKIPRSSIWQISSLSDKMQASIRAAAKVYKRGVYVAGNNVENHPPKETIVTFLAENGFLDAGTVGPLEWMFVQNYHTTDAMLIDQDVYNLWQHRLQNFKIPFIKIPAIPETKKSLQTAVEVSHLIPTDASRVIVIGGGVLGDVAGFVAGVRGIPTVYIPTTLLAVSDSSVGGKTGVNHPMSGKNQIGLFHPPQEVFIWNGWLETLSHRQLRSGLVEGLKHALISGNRRLWTALVDISARQAWSEVGPYLPQIIEVKVDIVGRDPWERGERAVLNFGHTMGHATEALSVACDGGRNLTHGECVAFGMVYALLLSQKLNIFGDPSHLVKDLAKARVLPHLSTALKANLNKVSDYLDTDKKNKSGKVQWVLMKDFGKIHRDSQGQWTHPVEYDESLLNEAIKQTLV